VKLSNYLKKSISTGLGNSLGSALVCIIFIPLIIQRIGMEKYGAWAILFIFIGISSVADLGLSKSLVYFITKQRSQKQINEVYSAGFCLNTLIVLLVAIAGLAIYWSGLNVWGSNESISYELGRRILLCGFVIMCCSLATSFYRSVLEAFYKIYLVNVGFLLLTTLNYSSVYVLSFFSTNIQYFIVCTVGVYITTLLFHMVLVLLGTEASLCVAKLSTFRQILKKALSFFFIGTLNILVEPTNRYLFAFLAGDARAYGFFDIALKIATMARGCLAAFALPLFSVFAGYGRAGISKIKQILNRYLVGLGASYALGCTLFLIAGKYILHAFITTESPHLFHASFILVLGVALYGVAEPYVRALLALGDLRVSFNIKAVQIASNLSLIVLLAKLTPLYRFSLAYSLAFSIAAVLYILVFTYKYWNWPRRLCEDYRDKAKLAVQT
jgi:O-antigen/teichoic acid export membrane protein